MNILQGYCLLALTLYIQFLMFYIYYTIKVVRLQLTFLILGLLVIHLIVETTSVLTHLIKKDLNLSLKFIYNLAKI